MVATESYVCQMQGRLRKDTVLKQWLSQHFYMGSNLGEDSAEKKMIEPAKIKL
jgi:hypothetical protein